MWNPAAAHKALSTGPVLLSEADGKKLLFQDLKSGKDLIQTPFGNLPTISEKVGSVVGWTATPRPLGVFAYGRAWREGGGGLLLAGVVFFGGVLAGA